ncbi:hypothetical protein [Lysinibacillus xylanilyticus]|uniref:Uncharacterized protein n=1 Tax=Lysinibacillus xylanilyticus TaxID=582475 RepID=A0A2M9Q782_9BACI|nr:hypothetical protein [Lysinibacillus xylanilyticus]PJO43929.1 hypothetical protein CWD94_10110 [Lysinibacillus xylanilyticus]
MIIIGNSEATKTKVLGVFSFGEIAVEYDMSTMPQPENKPGKSAELFYDKVTKQLYYEYKDIPKTEIELLQEENEKFKVSQADQDENIMLMMLEMGGN